MPAGRRLIYRSNVEKYSEYVFEGIDPGFSLKCKKEKDAGRAAFIVARESYGQGSSREHAALCPMFLGVKAVLARSIERIHFANLINFGILPLTLASLEDYRALSAGDELEMPRLGEELGTGKITVKNITSGREFTVNAVWTPRQTAILQAGGLLNYTVKEGGAMKEVPHAQ